MTDLLPYGPGWVITNPEKGGLQEQDTGICLQATVEPLRRISIQKGVLHPVCTVSYEVRASAQPRLLPGCGARGRRAPRGLARLWNPVVDAILVTALGTPGAGSLVPQGGWATPRGLAERPQVGLEVQSPAWDWHDSWEASGMLGGRGTGKKTSL